MSDWRFHQRTAGRIAYQAETCEKNGEIEKAKTLYHDAADEMEMSFLTPHGDKNRLSSTVQSVVELYQKAGDSQKVEELACKWIPSQAIDERSKAKLRQILSSMWNVEILQVEHIQSTEAFDQGLGR